MKVHMVESRDLHPDLVVGLGHISRAARRAGLTEDWWIFGGAAMALWGLRGWEVPDIDVIAGEAAAHTLIAELDGHIQTPAPGGRFRSALLATLDTGPIPTEVMVDLEVETDEGWRSAAFTTRVALSVDDALIYAPEPDELIATARLFGRPKDLARADGLAAALTARY